MRKRGLPKSPVRKNRTPGSVRGALRRPYRDWAAQSLVVLEQAEKTYVASSLLLRAGQEVEPCLDVWSLLSVSGCWPEAS